MSILNGKAVVITGSGRGIGAACAKGAARQGASVVVNDIDAPEANETAAAIMAEGGKAVACVADVSKWEEAGRLIETCISAFGKIDGLVNNAGLYHVAKIDAFDPTTARSMVDANVLGPLFCTGHAVKPMLKQGSGSIINVISGAHMGMPTMGVYGATKGAVASMIYTWAMELAGSGVRVNGLSPLGATRMGVSHNASPEERARLYAHIQKPEANSPVVEFLLSDLSKDVNGQVIRIDKDEIQLYVHPALLLPPVVRATWTAEAIAEAFKRELKDRQVPCGVLGMTDLPVEPKSGIWKRRAEAAS
ncbi:MAG: SDR family oxidoreductase [Rhodospirillaceae bacterium]|nr:MAG: SDR family oxidoreductase [Rhodospirillaceae bacterium]